MLICSLCRPSKKATSPECVKNELLKNFVGTDLLSSLRANAVKRPIVRSAYRMDASMEWILFTNAVNMRLTLVYVQLNKFTSGKKFNASFLGKLVVSN